MKTTISITLDTEDAVARNILYQLVSAIDMARGTEAPEGSIFHDPESGSFYDEQNPFHVVMRSAEIQREREAQEDRTPVREFDPIEVRSRHLEVIQRLKKGKASARQLAPKLRGHWTQQEVSNSLAYLKRLGLVERQVGSRYWVATAKAKAHPLVAA